MKTNRIESYYTPRQAAEYEANRKDAIWYSENDVFVKLLRRVVNELDQESLTILDLPCGTGRWIPFLEHNITKYLGVDISENMLIEASKRVSALSTSHARRHQFINCSYQELSKKDDCRYELSICTRFLTHFDIHDVEDILSVLRAKTEGFAIVMVRAADTRWNLIIENVVFVLSNPIRAVKRWKKSGRISNSKLRSAYLSAFQKAGFSISDIECVHTFQYSKFEYWLVH